MPDLRYCCLSNPSVSCVFIINLLNIEHKRSVTFMSSLNLLKNGSSLVKGLPDVSSVVCTPFSFASLNSAITKSICNSASPPLTVIPPFFSSSCGNGMLCQKLPLPSVLLRLPLPMFPGCGSIYSACGNPVKYNIAHTRSVYRAEALYRMYFPFNFLCIFHF